MIININLDQITVPKQLKNIPHEFTKKQMIVVRAIDGQYRLVHGVSRLQTMRDFGIINCNCLVVNES